MSREVRRVPLDWQHPKSTDVSWSRGKPVPVPLFPREDYEDHLAEWERMDPQEQQEEPRPQSDQYMPDFSGVPEDDMGWCMYETTSEGTPLSPVFKTQEELARWLADNGASASGCMTATYDQWLATIRRGWAPSMMFSPSTGLVSGVQAMTGEGR